MAGEAAVGQHLHAPGAVHLRAALVSQHQAQGRGLHPGRPDLRKRLDPTHRAVKALHAEPVDVDAGDARAEPDLDAQALQVSPGAALQ